MKRILIIHTHGGIGGAGQSLLEIIESLDRSKLYPIVYCPRVPNTMVKILKSRGIEVISDDSALPTYPHYSGASITKINILFWVRTIKIFTKGIPRLRKLIEKTNPHCVVVNSMTYAWTGKYINSSIKKVCFHRETYMETIFGIRTKILKNLLVRYFDKVVFITNFDKSLTTSLRDNQGTVVKDSVEINEGLQYDVKDYKKKLGLGIDDKHILFVGGFNRIKGGEIALKALLEIKDPKIKLLFLPVVNSKNTLYKKIKRIFRFDQEHKMKSYISRKDLSERVIMFPPQEDMKKFYMAADLVIFPSRYPHQARPVFEAGALKKTIVMSRYKATEESVKDHYNGLYFTPNNSSELALCIEKVLYDTKLRVELENNNYNHTKQNHNMKLFKKQIKDIFLEIFDEKEAER